MCQLEFLGRNNAKTCSPRCRKRYQRVLKGEAVAGWRMKEPPNPKASKLWR